MSKEKYISLKEAAKISGYSPDYVGQLIRQGKLQGKQVFQNVAWVTTEEAVQNYIERQKKGGSDFMSLRAREALTGWMDIDVVYKVVIGGVIAICTVFVLFLFSIFSVSVDHWVNNHYEQQLQQP